MSNICLFCGKSCRNKFCSNSCSSRFIYQEKNKIHIDNNLHNIIEGTLFSDAGLELDVKNRNINPRYYFKQTRYREEYVRYIASLFGCDDKVRFANNKAGSFKKNDNVDCRFKTAASISLLPYYNRWYPNGGFKRIPQDISVTSTFLLHAYLGDGFMYKGTSYYGRYKCWKPAICTNGFLQSDLSEIFLPKLLEIGIKASINYKRGCGKEYPIVYISRYSYADFFNYIGPSPLKSLEYRWGGFVYSSATVI